MELLCQGSNRVLAGLFFTATCVMPQAYTISAKPGAVNYVEGSAYLDGQRLSEKATRATFLRSNDTLSTDDGKAEVLLSPGVFLRVGRDSQIRMISPSLVNTQLEVSRGEAMLEVSGLVKDNTVQVTDHGAAVTIDKDGLYRFTADPSPAVAVLDGKALVNFGDRETSVGKGREFTFADASKVEKFNTRQEDDLYAWSNVRSQFDAAASYGAARSVSANSFSGWGEYGFGGYGLGLASAPGWYWASGFNSWAWLPGSGAFYNPFGYGFYSPGSVAYAPVVYAPVSGGFASVGGINAVAMRAPVPVNPNHPAAVGTIAASPFASQVARAQAAQSFAAAGFRTASGAPVAAFSGAHMTSISQGGQIGVANVGGGGLSSGGRAASGGSSAGGGGAHAAGGGGGHR